MVAAHKEAGRLRPLRRKMRAARAHDLPEGSTVRLRTTKRRSALEFDNGGPMWGNAAGGLIAGRMAAKLVGLVLDCEGLWLVSSLFAGS